MNEESVKVLMSKQLHTGTKKYGSITIVFQINTLATVNLSALQNKKIPVSLQLKHVTNTMS
jgi:hypothetical protein